MLCEDGGGGAAQRGPESGGAKGPERSLRRLNVSILLAVVMVPWLRARVRAHQTQHFKREEHTVCLLHLCKADKCVRACVCVCVCPYVYTLHHVLRED